MTVSGLESPMTFDVAIVGTGPDPTARDRTGFAMGYRHAAAYEQRDDCRLRACVDLERSNAEAFARAHDMDDGSVFEDHRAMLSSIQPDIVSVCVPPSAHAEIVMDGARTPGVKAIHCEKPMANRWPACQEMVSTCARENVQLTIDHQRRLAKPVVRGKALVDQGAIGEIRRVEWAEVNLFDAGSHCFDLCDLFVGGAHPEWVLAGVDVSEDTRWFGELNSTRAIAHWQYDNGVQGIASTSDGGATAIDAYLRVIGTEGELEIQPDDGPPLRLRTDGGWQAVETDGENLFGPPGSRLRGALAKVEEIMPGRAPSGPVRPNYRRAIDHAVSCLETGREPTISGITALRSTALIFGAWESARSRGRVDFPLRDVENPLTDLRTSPSPAEVSEV